jgi:hypothetical protein
VQIQPRVRMPTAVPTQRPRRPALSCSGPPGCLAQDAIFAREAFSERDDSRVSLFAMPRSAHCARCPRVGAGIRPAHSRAVR